MSSVDGQTLPAIQNNVSVSVPYVENSVREGVSNIRLDASEDEKHPDNDYYKLGPWCKIGKGTFWCLSIGFVVLGAAAILTTVVFQTIHKQSKTGSSTDSPHAHSEAYYQERFTTFSQVAAKLSESPSIVQPDTPQSQALDWMIYQDSTVPHKPLEETQFAQRYAIMVLFYACGGEEWQGFEDGRLDHQNDQGTCQWEGNQFIVCNDFGEVVELNLNERRLIGELPVELGLLTSLQTLHLGSNYMKGPLPIEIFTHMTSLHTLRLPSNEFAGSIPSDLGKLTTLEYLDLSLNYLTGSLPKELQNLTSLQSFQINGNEFVGPFFEPFGVSWASLKYLNLDSTQLTGTIPALALKQWTNSMEEFVLGSSTFHGALPTDVSNLYSLTKLFIVGPGLEGPFPDLSKLESLQQLHLEGVSLTGSIPSSIGRLTELTELWISKMDITGTIPSEIGNCANLLAIDISHTKITGTIPREIGNSPSLDSVVIRSDLMVGSIPVGLCNRSPPINIQVSCSFECSCCDAQTCF